MKKIAILLFAILGIACKNDKKQENSNPEEDLMAKAKQIHQNVITLDTHDDINVNNFTDSLNYTQDLDTQVTLPKMIEGGLDVAWFIVYTGQDTLTVEGFEKAHKNAMDKFNAIHALTKEIAPDKIGLAVNSEEVRAIHKSGKKVAMIGIENGYPVGNDIKNVEKFYDLGARYMSLAHNGHSQLSDSNTGEENDEWLHNGLSDLGKEVIAEMNRLGMMIDVSHPSKEAMKQMIELSKAPIIASHSSARALCDHSRNLDDEQLMWMKENGGVVQTVAFSSYLNTEKHNTRNDYMTALYNKVADSMNVKWYDWKTFRTLDEDAKAAFIGYYPKVRSIAEEKVANSTDAPEAVSVKDFVNHIDYMVKLIGIDHVGISSDFDGGGGIKGWEDASETFNVTYELVKRGYTEAQIEKLWSGNLLRVLDEAQEVAQKIQAESAS
ncbi:dipeptidase [Spongiivirga citrea]|uniref:Membrane dipeptidase n=1 Tax=Spongiivirga citrea TaxID=1481457 RepID=A0A6M0CG51_9FLAO|nr:dipeptidase [Spongiivirga citrea]NER16432.1 membrane dipeptidase [Spongiivirga citrea]